MFPENFTFCILLATRRGFELLPLSCRGAWPPLTISVPPVLLPLFDKPEVKLHCKQKYSQPCLDRLTTLVTHIWLVSDDI